MLLYYNVLDYATKNTFIQIVEHLSPIRQQNNHDKYFGNKSIFSQCSISKRSLKSVFKCHPGQHKFENILYVHYFTNYGQFSDGNKYE